MEKVVRILLDDVEPGEVEADAGTVSFAYMGKSYELDLNTKNAGKIDADFQRWIKHARPAGRTKPVHQPTRRSTTGPSGYDPDTLKAIREWARKNGWPNQSDKGRVPGEVLLAFEQRHDVAAPNFSAKGT